MPTICITCTLYLSIPWFPFTGYETGIFGDYYTNMAINGVFFFELMKARLHVRVSYPCRHFITPPLVTQSVLYFTKKRSLVK